MVSIDSVMQNASSDHMYQFYLVIDQGFGEETKRLCQEAVSRYDNCRIEFLEISADYSSLYRGIPHVTFQSYYRLFLPQLLSKIDKCIYLDGDTVVCSDIAGLYEVELGDNWLGGVEAYGYYRNADEHCKRLGIATLPPYFNSGVLLISLEALRKNGCPEKFETLIWRKYDSVDQDVLNVACRGYIMKLPYRFNVMTGHFNYDRDYLAKYISLAELDAARADPVIIHYAGAEKPWNSAAVPLSEKWNAVYLKGTIRDLFADAADQKEKAAASVERDGNAKVSPKVSVIMPVYNADEHLEKAAESVLRQTIDSWELICINDGSTDDSLQRLNALAKRDARIKVLSQENQGSGPARNLGLRTAAGEFISFLDADDLYPEDCTLEKLYRAAVDHGVSCAGGSMSVLTSSGKLWDTFEGANSGQKFQSRGISNYSQYQFEYGYQRFIFQRSMLIDNGIFFPPYLRFQDPPFMVTAMICAQRFYHMPDVTYLYREGHKAVSWNEEKVCGLLHGLIDLLQISSRHRYKKLHLSAIYRIGYDHCQPIASHLHNPSVAELLRTAIGNIDIGLLDGCAGTFPHSIIALNWDDFTREFSPNAVLKADTLSWGTHNDASAASRIIEAQRLSQQVSYLEREIENIHRSASYRIGRMITFIPRKLRGGIRCLKENGIKYTLCRFGEKVRAKLR